MKMKPSRKILIGASVVGTGIALQVIAALLAVRHMDDITHQLKTADASSAIQIDQQLEQTHWLMSAALFGTYLSYLLLVAGLLLVFIGAYQNAKNTEKLLENTVNRSLPQVP